MMRKMTAEPVCFGAAGWHHERNIDMKKRILLLLLTMVLALSFTLAACGDKTQGASPDSATSDSASKDSAAVSSYGASSSAVSQADDHDNAAPAPAADNNSDKSNNGGSGNNSGNNNAQDEKNTPAPADNNNKNNDNGSSQQSSSKASSQSSSKASSGNPAYKEGEEPSYTISMTNKSTKKSYSAGCSFSKDDDKLVTTTFYLPGGDYEVAVYAYTEEKDKGDPKATDTYKNNIKEKERKSIRVTYNTETGKIKVEEMKSDRTQ